MKCARFCIDVDWSRSVRVISEYNRMSGANGIYGNLYTAPSQNNRLALFGRFRNSSAW